MTLSNVRANSLQTLLLVVWLLAPALVEASGVGGVESWVDQLLVWLERAHPSQIVGVLLIAPLFGVPLSLLLLVIGLALPTPWALVATVFTLCVHHLLMLVLSRTSAAQWLRRELCERKLLRSERSRQSLTNDLLFTLTVAWAPGVSYIFKVAIVALASLPLRRYFLFGVFSQLTAAVPYLLLGEVVRDVGVGWLPLMVFVALVAVWGLKHLISRLMGAARL